MPIQHNTIIKQYQYHPIQRKTTNSYPPVFVFVFLCLHLLLYLYLFMYFHCRDDRGPSVHLTLLMALPLWNQRLGTRFGSRFLTRCGRTGYSDGPILMALGKHDVLPVRGKLMRRFFAVIYFQPVSHFHENKLQD